MMLLKAVYMYLDLDAYPVELITPFGFQTRYICNFVQRRLRGLRFHAEGFNRICVEGRHVPMESCPILSENAAVPTVAFDQPRYESRGPDDHHELFIAMLREGLEKCARFHRIPMAELSEFLDEFRRGGYQNEWLHKRQLLRPVGLHASLLCRLDIERFVLTLKLERKGETLFEEAILETLPDEIIFAHQFRKVVLEGDTLVVRGLYDIPTFSLKLASLGLSQPGTRAPS